MAQDNHDQVLVKAQNKVKEKSNKYNESIIELILHPKNWGKLDSSEISVWQAYEGPCGDTMQFFFKIQDEIIEEASFFTSGCGASIAAASQTTILIKGKSLEYAESLKPNDIDVALGGFPDDHKHCIELAVRTIKNAIKKYKLDRS